MEITLLINNLEKEWELETECLGKLREGTLDAEGFRRLRSLLSSTRIDGQMIDRRLVSLTWYVPTFMSWQLERVREKGGDVIGLENTINEVLGNLEKFLGVP
jgi:hypothetical protein